jgi:hypothetical protein
MMKGVSTRLCHSVSPVRIGTLMRFGFTERQARFLVHVLVFSGVFIERQYRAFTGLAHGQKTHDFLAKLITAGYATPITPGALHRGRLYHVQYKAERFMPSDAAHNGGIRITVRSPRRWA